MSTPPTRFSDELEQIVEVADRELQSVDPTPFSPQAFLRLKEKVSEYAVQLITESVKRARRHQAETASTSDVEQASQYLVASSSHKFYRHMGTFGGLFLGSALSNVLSMITTNQFALNGIIVTFILTLVGSFMIAAHIVKE